MELELYDRTTEPPTLVSSVSRAGLGNGRTDGLLPFTATAATNGRAMVYRERIVTTTSGRSTGWTSFDVAEEQFWVGEIFISSNVSASAMAVGGRVTDTVYLHGLAPGETATVELELFDLTVDPDGTGEPLLRASAEGLLDGQHDGLAPFVVTANLNGHRVGYRHRVATTTMGRSTKWSWLGDNSESFGVGQLNVGTQVSLAVATVGSTVTDAVYIEGLAPDETATAELQIFDLTVDPQGLAAPLGAWTAPGLVNGNNIGLASFVIPATADNHRLGYRERITTSTGRTTQWSTLGAASETFVVTDDPCVAGPGETQTPSVGQTIFDAVIVNGLLTGERATVELQLYDLTVDPDGRTPLATFTLRDVGNGTTTGGDYVVPASAAGHRLGYRERIATTTTGRSTPWSALGRPSETVSVCLI